jgi:hypothetical protein
MTQKNVFILFFRRRFEDTLVNTKMKLNGHTGQTERWTKGQIDRWMNGWTARQTNRWMYGEIDMQADN